MGCAGPATGPPSGPGHKMANDNTGERSMWSKLVSNHTGHRQSP